VWVQSEREVYPRRPCCVLLAAAAIPRTAKIIRRFMTVFPQKMPRYDPAVSKGCRPSSNWYRLYLGGPQLGFGDAPPAQDSNVQALRRGPLQFHFSSISSVKACETEICLSPLRARGSVYGFCLHVPSRQLRGRLAVADFGSPFVWCARASSRSRKRCSPRSDASTIQAATESRESR